MVRLTDCPDMTIAVDWDVKHQTNQKLAMYRCINDYKSSFKFNFLNIISLNCVSDVFQTEQHVTSR